MADQGGFRGPHPPTEKISEIGHFDKIWEAVGAMLPCVLYSVPSLFNLYFVFIGPHIGYVPDNTFV